MGFSSAICQPFGNDRLAAAAVSSQACFLVMFEVAWFPGGGQEASRIGKSFSQAWSCPHGQPSREAWAGAGTATFPVGRGQQEVTFGDGGRG